MGPSGAGKDSVLQFARDALVRDEKIAFAHRYITRASGAGGENHIALSEAEFETRRAAGLFAFDWQAHGFRYGVGIEIETWRRAGFVVVVSGSRAHFRTLDLGALTVCPVLITAPTAILEQRLATRGREGRPDVAERLQRATDQTLDDPAIVVIENTGRIEDAGTRFVRLLRDIATRFDGPTA